jgi:hypothetical protein
VNWIYFGVCWIVAACLAGGGFGVIQRTEYSPMAAAREAAGVLLIFAGFGLWIFGLTFALTH